MRDFATRLRRAREAKGIESAEQFAHLLAMSPHAYRKYERGQSEPNFETLRRMCDLLGITPNDLLGERAKTSARRKSSRTAGAAVF